MTEKILPVPFVSQHWNLDDWKNLGFTSRDDAEYWERSSCGVLCLQMAIDYLTGCQLKTVDLIHQGQKIGAYTDALGWSHEGLARLAKENDLMAKHKHMSPEEILVAIDQNEIPIISIKWAFKTSKTLKEKILFWKKYGGHLAIVVGYKTEGEKIIGFYVHHTSKRLEQNWVSRFMPLLQFQAGYTGRAIVISNPT